MDNKVLVTGCAGFIGSHLTEKLLSEGFKVVGIDAFTPYYSRAIKERNMSSFIDNDNFEFYEANLINYNLKQLLHGISTVYHLAAQPGVRYSWEGFKEYVNNNILATQRLLEACRENDTKIVFASSSSVYGNAKLPENEKTPLNPKSPYALTKEFDEKLCTLYHETYGLNAIMLRFFTVYGPRQRPDMAINIFTHKLLSGEPIEIYGDGRQKRDFTYVSDIVEGNFLAGTSKIKFDTFNIGTGNSITINKLIKLLGDVAGVDPLVVHVGKAAGDVRDTRASIAKAKKKLGYSPKVKIKDGIKKYIEWYKKYNLK